MNKIEGILVEELKVAGYSYKGINDLYNQSALPSGVVEIILKWLPSVYEEHLGSGEHLVRSLIAAEQPFDPIVLIKLFEESSYNSTIKCSIAHVLSTSKTHDISDWIRLQLLERRSSFKRAGLLEGLVNKAGIKKREEFMQVLKEIFNKYCYFESYLKLYQKYADADDIPFLEEKLKHADLTIYREYANYADAHLGSKQVKEVEKRFAREVSKLIESIKKRKRRYRFPAGL